MAAFLVMAGLLFLWLQGFLFLFELVGKSQDGKRHTQSVDDEGSVKHFGNEDSPIVIVLGLNPEMYRCLVIFI